MRNMVLIEIECSYMSVGKCQRYGYSTTYDLHVLSTIP